MIAMDFGTWVVIETGLVGGFIAVVILLALLMAVVFVAALIRG